MTEFERIEYLLKLGYSATENGDVISHRGRKIIRVSKYEKGRKYLIISFKIKKFEYKVRGHRFIFYYFNHFLPEIVDHKNWNTLDNSLSNLRSADPALNSQNRQNIKGYWKTKSGKYSSRITYRGKRKNLGTFNTKEEASAEYFRWKAILHI